MSASGVFTPGPSSYAFHLGRIEAESSANQVRSVQDQVIEDMIERKKFGLKKYGKEIMPEDNRDMLKETSEELMDALVYLKAESNVRAELRNRIRELKKENRHLREEVESYQKEMHYPYS